VWGHGRVLRSSGGGSPWRVVCEFPADCIFSACCEVVELVEALEEPATSDIADGE
jgi:hypothetical protein